MPTLKCSNIGENPGLLHDSSVTNDARRLAASFVRMRLICLCARGLADPAATVDPQLGSCEGNVKRTKATVWEFRDESLCSSTTVVASQWLLGLEKCVLVARVGRFTVRFRTWRREMGSRVPGEGSHQEQRVDLANP